MGDSNASSPHRCPARQCYASSLTTFPLSLSLPCRELIGSTGLLELEKKTHHHKTPKALDGFSFENAKMRDDEL